MKKIYLIVAIMLLKTTLILSQNNKVTVPINIGKAISKIELANIVDDEYYEVQSFTISEDGNSVTLFLLPDLDYHLIINEQEYFNFTISSKDNLDISSDMNYAVIDGTINFYN